MAAQDDIPQIPTPPADVTPPPPAAPAEQTPPPVEAAPVVPPPPPVEAPPAAAAPAAPVPPPAPATDTGVPGYQAAPPPAAPGTPPPPPPAPQGAPNPYAVPQPYSVAQPQGYAQAPAYGQPGSAQPGYPGYQAGYAPGPSSGLSITSMVLGIAGIVLSFMFLGFLPSLAAVITGHIASKRQPHAKGMWLTGIITGYVGLAISVITFIFIIGVSFLASTTFGR